MLKLYEVTNSKKPGYFYKLKKPTWIEILVSKKTTCLGKIEHMVALCDEKNFTSCMQL
jgi:hypothetical protein